jgi:hypothetical protein
LKKFLILIVLSVFLTAILGIFTNVFAFENPSFTSCSNPEGTQITYFDSGSHGVAGDSSSHQGSDAVYIGANSDATQCLCETTGQGIQTNWWKINGMSQPEINQNLNSGWNYIADGSAWGLDNSPYLAKNVYYICGPLGIGGGGDVLAASTSSSSSTTGEVLGLASTGDHDLKFWSLFLGLSIISFGLYLHDEKNI